MVLIFAFEVNKMSERPFWAKFQLILFPIVAFESLSDLIRDRLQESVGQGSLENHLMLLEALIKHWKGEVLSVAVTRIAQNCKSFWILFWLLNIHTKNSMEKYLSCAEHKNKVFFCFKSTSIFSLRWLKNCV